MSDLLKLTAQRPDDVPVLSAALQDAILRIGDITYDKKGRFVSLRLSRYRHEGGAERVLAGLRIDSVLSMRVRGIAREDPDAMMVLLSVEFKAGKTNPEGQLRLIFAGDGELSIHLECIDILMADTAQRRTTDKIPLHPDN